MFIRMTSVAGLLLVLAACGQSNSTQHSNAQVGGVHKNENGGLVPGNKEPEGNAPGPPTAADQRR
jgi:hypothetical protein